MPLLQGTFTKINEPRNAKTLSSSDINAERLVAKESGWWGNFKTYLSTAGARYDQKRESINTSVSNFFSGYWRTAKETGSQVVNYVKDVGTEYTGKIVIVVIVLSVIFFIGFFLSKTIAAKMSKVL